MALSRPPRRLRKTARPSLAPGSRDRLSYSHIANLASGRDIPSRHPLELLAGAFQLPAGYFAEYRLAELRRQLDEREVGFATAYRTYQTLS